MDIKTEIEIKDEPLESTQYFRNNGQSFEQDSGVEKIQKKKINTKVEVKEEMEEYSENGEHIDQISGLDEGQGRKFNPKVEAKEEIEINDPFEFTEEYSENDQVKEISKLDERQKTRNNPKVEVRGEIEINCPFNFTEEYSENGEHVEKISKLDESQTLISGMGKREKGDKLIVNSSSLRCEPETSQKHYQLMKEMDLKKVHCTSCNFSFKSKDELKSHMKSHKKTKFKCALCSYESNHKSKLKSHTLTHLDVKLLKCSECSYECNLKGSLKCHMLTHSKTKPFKCTECSYTCKRETYLKTHMLKHSKHKLFKCNDCNFESVTKGELKKHVLTHTNDKDNKKWTLPRNLYLMESYYIGELIPTKKDQNEQWKYVVENNKFIAIDYMYYRYTKKFEKVNRREMMKQKRYILDVVNGRKEFSKLRTNYSLPTKEDLEEIKLKAKNIVENEMENTVELVKNIKAAKDNRCRLQRKKQGFTHVEEESSGNESKEESENERNRKKEKEINEKIWKNVRVRNIFQ